MFDPNNYQVQKTGRPTSERPVFFGLFLNPVPYVLSCGYACEPTLLLLAFSRRVSGKTSDALLP
jgi:hypothetical protein